MADRILTIRMDEEEYRSISREAREEGISISTYCRRLIGLGEPTSLTQMRIEMSELHDDMAYVSFEHEMTMNMIIEMFSSLLPQGTDPVQRIREIQKRAAEKVIRRRANIDSSLDPFLTEEIENAVETIAENRRGRSQGDASDMQD